jgi:hypothetical protein
VKHYKRRDSATSVLRKLGIKTRDYNLFINTVEDGVELDDELAKSHAKQLKVQTGEVKPKEIKPKAQPKTTTPTGQTCCGVAYELIKQGKTNQEVWEVIQPMFNLDDKKRHYPSWYRCHLRRIGELSQDTRVRQQGVQVIYE